MRFLPSNLTIVLLTPHRKLSILHPPDDMPLVLSLSDYSEVRPNPQAENFFSADFQNHLLTFLSYLAFWQDVLEHCRSVDVRHTLIDHFQILFLQQLLFVHLQIWKIGSELTCIDIPLYSSRPMLMVARL